jgi:hypothetical protein
VEPSYPDDDDEEEEEKADKAMVLQAPAGGKQAGGGPGGQPGGKGRGGGGQQLLVDKWPVNQSWNAFQAAHRDRKMTSGDWKSAKAALAAAAHDYRESDEGEGPGLPHRQVDCPLRPRHSKMVGEPSTNRQSIKPNKTLRLKSVMIMAIE